MLRLQWRFIAADGVEMPLEEGTSAFITMNPGYIGRAELPESLKALFRPVSMVLPDLALICEIMLMAEGFQMSKLLSRKFVILYKLCEDLLSKVRARRLCRALRWCPLCTARGFAGQSAALFLVSCVCGRCHPDKQLATCVRQAVSRSAPVLQVVSAALVVVSASNACSCRRVTTIGSCAPSRRRCMLLAA
jgi:hypothetical protein